MTRASQYIVLMAADDAAHKQLVDLLKQHIGESITYIDVMPEAKVFKDRDDNEHIWLKVDR